MSINMNYISWSPTAENYFQDLRKWLNLMYLLIIQEFIFMYMYKPTYPTVNWGKARFSQIVHMHVGHNILILCVIGS